MSALWHMKVWLTLTCAEPMCSNIDDVVGSRHDMHISIIVDHTCIAGIDPFAIEPFQISLKEPHIIAEESSKRGRPKWHRQHNITHITLLNFLALIVNDPHVKPWHWFPCRSGLDLQRLVGLCAGVLFPNRRSQCQARNRRARF